MPTMSRYCYFVFIHFFHFDLEKCNEISCNIMQNLIPFMKAILSQVSHPSHLGQGQGSLTCHMTPFEQSDWMRSADFINIMIECISNARKWFSNWQSFVIKALQTSYNSLTIYNSTPMDYRGAISTLTSSMHNRTFMSAYVELNHSHKWDW